MIKKILIINVILLTGLFGLSSIAQSKETPMKSEYVCYATFDVMEKLGTEVGRKDIVESSITGKQELKKNYDMNFGIILSEIKKLNKEFYDQTIDPNQFSAQWQHCQSKTLPMMKARMGLN